MRSASPTFFIWARDIKDQATIEVNTLRQVGLIGLLTQLRSSKKKWKQELPLQLIKEFNIPFFSLQKLSSNLQGYKEGGHTFYFSPDLIKDSDLSNLTKKYPNLAAIKIIKRQGGISKPFPAPDKTCKSHAFLSPSHRELLLVHNLFYMLGMGPRLYDLIELTFQNGDKHVAYILEHIDGLCPSDQDCRDFIESLKKLEHEALIKLVNWNGYQDMDFACPGCNGNLLYDKASKSLKYVDLQNFAIGDYYSFLKSVALEASAASHFGQKSYLMGGKHLYQSIPGLNMGAKRSPAERFKTIKKLLDQADALLNDKLVLDVGCNIGLMGAQYLKEGASWLHGFDMPKLIKHTEKVLLSVGCTKFSLSGSILSDQVSLIEQLPDFLKENLHNSVISYLAIRGHIGWIKELALIPWLFMIYEGHQEEDMEMSRQFIQQLNMLRPCSIVSEGWIADANSTPRYLAIIKAVPSGK